MLRTISKDNMDPLTERDFSRMANAYLDLASACRLSGLHAEATAILETVAWYQQQAIKTKANHLT